MRPSPLSILLFTLLVGCAGGPDDERVTSSDALSSSTDEQTSNGENEPGCEPAGKDAPGCMALPPGAIPGQSLGKRCAVGSHESGFICAPNGNWVLE